MALTDPLSLREVRRLSGSADTILLTATRNADLETPIGAFMRFDDGGPAFLLESVEGGERLGRYSFMGVGPRRLLTVRDGRATIQTRPVGVTDFSPDLPTETLPAPDPLAALRQFLPEEADPPRRGHPAVPGRGGGRARLRRRLHVRADGAAAGDATRSAPRWPPSRRRTWSWSSTT